MIASEDADYYIGQAVTVEGYVDSVVYASSSSGSPYFINLGGGAYAPAGLAVVIWSEDLSRSTKSSLYSGSITTAVPLAVRMIFVSVDEFWPRKSSSVM